MTSARLVFQHIRARPARSLMVLGFAALSLFVFGFLRSVVTSLDAAVKSVSADRLVVSSAVSLFSQLPASYREPIESIEGVRSVSRWTWFGGHWRDPKYFFPSLATDLDVFLAQFPEVLVDEDAKQALLSDRRGCLIGEGLAREHGFKVGDTIPLVGTFYPLPDKEPWEFVVRGIYRIEDPVLPDKALFFHWTYLDEMRQRIPASAGLASSVSMFRVRLAPGTSADEACARIEARYDAGPQRVRAQTESQFRAQRIRSMGDVPGLLAWIGGAVFLAMMLSVVNATAMAARERAREAGILKALGFPDRSVASLLVAESCALVGVGGLLGILLCAATAVIWKRALLTMLPAYRVEPQTIAMGIVISLAMGAVGGLLPSLNLMRLRPVAVLREDA